jgi:hypothetical protein
MRIGGKIVTVMKGPYSRAKVLRNALTMLDEDRMRVQPDGTIIVAGIKECAGVFTLVKNGSFWFSFLIYGDTLELEMMCTPEPPGLLVLYGDEDDEDMYTPFGPLLSMIKGGKDEE